MTTARTLLTVQGPRSRELLPRLTTADLSNEAFPYMRAQEIDVVPRRGVLALRVTYLGELGWELHIPERRGADGLRRALRGRRGSGPPRTPGSAR